LGFESLPRSLPAELTGLSRLGTKGEVPRRDNPVVILESTAFRHLGRVAGEDYARDMLS
jgi:hypothetical protein